jgi:hypothetical protein
MRQAPLWSIPPTSGGVVVRMGRGIAVDGSGNAYVTGWTSSTDYDVTPGAFQTTNGGGADVFVTKLNGTGTALVYSTYIGGSGEDYGYGIAVDGSGNAYVTGRTNSTDYDVTPGAFQTTFGGNVDVFVTKLNAIGTALVYSTYIGGSGELCGLWHSGGWERQRLCDGMDFLHRLRCYTGGFPDDKWRREGCFCDEGVSSYYAHFRTRYR